MWKNKGERELWRCGATAVCTAFTCGVCKGALWAQAIPDPCKAAFVPAEGICLTINKSTVILFVQEPPISSKYAGSVSMLGM